MTNLKHYSHKIGVNFWHIEFATNYRYRMYGQFTAKNYAEESLPTVCRRQNIKIHTILSTVIERDEGPKQSRRPSVFGDCYALLAMTG